jgi:hypothetical protein
MLHASALIRAHRGLTMRLRHIEAFHALTQVGTTARALLEKGST